jgi:hypothetical protein
MLKLPLRRTGDSTISKGPELRLSLVALLVSTAMLAGAGAALAGGAAVPKISFAAAEDGWYSVSVQPAARVRVTLQAGSDCNFLNQVCKSYDTIDSKLVAKGTVGHISWIKASFWGQPPSRRGDTLYPGRYRMVFQVPGIKASVVTTTWNLQYGD